MCCGHTRGLLLRVAVDDAMRAIEYGQGPEPVNEFSVCPENYPGSVPSLNSRSDRSDNES